MALAGRYLNAELAARQRRHDARWRRESDNRAKVSDPAALQKFNTAQRLPPEKVAELCVEYRAGETIESLAANYRIARTTVMKHLKRNQVETRRNSRKMTDRAVAEANAEYREGSSLAKLALTHGVSATTVRKELLQVGCPIRPRRGSSR